MSLAACGGALLDRRYPGLLAEARLYLTGGYIAPAPLGYPQWYHSAEALARDERIEERYARTCPKLPAGIINFQHEPFSARAGK